MHNPIEAWDRIAPIYRSLADQRRRYLDSVDRLIMASVPPGSRSLLDVGAGNGSRARRIALDCGIADVMLLEPSIGMRGNADAAFSTMRAEELHRVDARFDVILCLWNVLGHVFPAESRIEVLRQFARLLTPKGKAFVDVNHRYNARHYGALPTALRFLYDRIAWSEENGDATVSWNINGERCATTGHVFTDREIQTLCRSAGLRIERRIVIDYATGQQRKWSIEGHLLYTLVA